MYRVSGDKKVIFGAPAHNRINKGFQKTVGLFIEIFPLVMELSEDDTFFDVLERVKLETNDYTFFFKHLLFVFLGIIIIFLLSSINEAKLFKFSPIIFIFSLISLLLVPIIGIEVNSAQRWIDLYFLPRFQPIELVKPFLK